MIKKKLNMLKITKITFTFLILFVFSFASNPGFSSVGAISLEQKKLYKQNVLYYDLENGCTDADGVTSVSNCVCNSASGSTSSVSGADNEAKIWNYLIGKGLGPVQAAGIIGNFAIESHFDPTIQERGKTPPLGGYGIAQWTGTGRPGDPAGARRLNMIKFVQDAGNAVDLTTQTAAPPVDNDKLLIAELDYMWQEGQSALAQIRRETTPELAARSWMNNYERPLVRIQPSRERAARIAFNKYSTGGAVPVTATTTPGTTSSCTAVSGPATGSLATTLKGYAWPDYHAPQYVQRMPAYALAVTQAQKAGKYVGGSVAGVPGIDCGGFVTLLITNSGFDPGYNYSGKGGNTISQEKWLVDNWTAFNPASTADLMPGDVAINTVHTYVYVGDVPGFNSKVASASFSTQGNGRAPMAGHETPANPSFNWYRKK